MGFWDRLFPRTPSTHRSTTTGVEASTPAPTVTVANIGSGEIRSDGSMVIDLPGPVDIDTQGRTSIDLGGGLSMRSDGSVNFNFNSSSFGSFPSTFDN